MTHLYELNKSAYDYYLSAEDEFKKICEPLINLGVPVFSYMKIFKDGSYLWLISKNLQYVQDYFSKISNIGEDFTREFNQVKHNQSHYYLLPANIEKYDITKDPIQHLLYCYNIWHTLSIYKTQNPDFIECYCFAAKREDIWFPNFCLNNIPLLERFITYFQDRAKDLIDTSDKSKLAYFQQQFDFFNSPPEKILDQKIKTYLEETTLKSLQFKGKYGEVKLSARELECIQYLALGNSAKEIAALLDLSARTIESHLINIKQKTGYYSRSKLVTNFVQNHPMMSNYYEANSAK